MKISNKNTAKFLTLSSCFIYCMLFWHFEPFWSNPVSFSHVQCIYILVLLWHKKLQLFIDGGGKSMTKTYWNHFEMSLLTPPPPPFPPQKSTPYFYNYYFWFSYMFRDFCAWAICESKKGDIQLEGTFTKYQSFRIVLKKVYHCLVTHHI